MTSHDIVFFGVATGTGAGHYHHAPGGRWLADREVPMPRALLTPGPDGRWCWPEPRTLEQIRRGSLPSDEQPEGHAYIHHAHGWTIISWWDRSEDKRGGCCAVFFLRGYRQWADAIRLAREAFPRDLGRMERAYSVALWGGDLPSPGEDPAAAIEAAATQEAERLRALHPDVLAALLRVMGWHQ